MKKIMLVIALPCALFAQNCLESSGQTKAFTFAPGAKAAWDHSSVSVKNHALAGKSASISIRQASTTEIAFAVHGMHTPVRAAISIYSMDGKKVCTVTVDDQSKALFNKRLAKGVYRAQLEADGKVLKTTMFLAGGGRP
jgi:hypothetical protein